ncbi:hypothetical protein F4679DRAFT_323814 [Xylaria curta]|nr:hypothetical protein F4679DRAFT_323814 [Xylaria curta]
MPVPVPRLNSMPAEFRNKVDIFKADEMPELMDNVIIRAATRAATGGLAEGNFYLKRKIGEGGFAEVYRMWDVRTGRSHAMEIRDLSRILLLTNPPTQDIPLGRLTLFLTNYKAKMTNPNPRKHEWPHSALLIPLSVKVSGFGGQKFSVSTSLS